MIIYNTTWLANQRLHDELEKDMQQGRITADEFAEIKQKYPVGFYTPNIFVRVGLFILTVIIVSFADGFLSLIAAGANMIDGFVWFLFLGLLSYIALEVVVQTKHHLSSGVDDALLIISACLVIIGFNMVIDKNSDGVWEHLALSLIIFAITLFLSLRFTDMPASATCAASFFAVIFFAWTAIVPSGIISAPFAMMLASAGAYWFARANAKEKNFIDYAVCLDIAQIVSLAALYAAGNYYIIQTLGNNMKGIDSQTHTPIPFGAFFWAWTILLPFIYLGFGIRKKDVILLRTGLALIAAGIFTFRNYYHLLPTDVMLTIGGAVILGIIYFVAKYLKTPKHGFTRDDLGDADAMDKLKVESLIIARTFAHTPQAPANEKFGGGDFGGGGSSGNY